MLRVACGLVAVLLVGSAGLADDKKKDAKQKLSGTWVREVEGFVVKFQFAKPEEMKIVVTNAGNGVTVTAKYSVDKDGVVKGTVTEVEEKGEFPGKPPKGMEFSFKFKAEGKKAKLEDFKSEKGEEAKPIVEGEYEERKDD